MKTDFKEETKQFYLPPIYPTLINVKKMKFIQAALSFTIKMEHKKLMPSDDYVILPLYC